MVVKLFLHAIFPNLNQPPKAPINPNEGLNIRHEMGTCLFSSAVNGSHYNMSKSIVTHNLHIFQSNINGTS